MTERHPGTHHGKLPFNRPWDLVRPDRLGSNHLSAEKSALSDSVQEAWIARYASGLAPSADFVGDMVVDNSGNVYLTGQSCGPTSGYDYATVKYNSGGIQQWVARYDGPAHDYDEATAIAVDPSGNVYVTGNSWGADMTVDYATVKYNSEGIEQWVARYSGSEGSDDYAADLAVDDSGNVYVTGVSTFSGASTDWVNVKYNATGIRQWVTRFAGPGNSDDNATVIAVDVSGNVVVTGSSWSCSSDDFATVKYDPAGNQLWVARYNGPGDSLDHPHALVTDDSGNVYIAGISTGSGTGCDYTTIKYDAAGAERWVVRHSGPGNMYDAANALAVDDSGYVYVTGVCMYGNFSNYATIKYCPSGTPLWVREYNSSGGFDDAVALAVDAWGNVFVTGISSAPGSSADYATIKYNEAGVQEWVSRYNGPVSDIDYAVALGVDGSGNVYATGVSFGLSSIDYATVKYNTGGSQQWVNRYTGPGNSHDCVADLAADDQGNTYIAGYSSGTETSDDYTTIKYNTSGVLQWAAHYNGPGNSDDHAAAVVIDPSGNVYVTGSSTGSSLNSDYATVKYNAAGAEQWVARYNGPGDFEDYACAIAIDQTGNVYVTGRSFGLNTGFDYATVKYDPLGVQLWVARYNGPANNDDYASGLAIDDSGNVYVTGDTYQESTGSDYATVKYNANGFQQWAVRYNGPGNSTDEASGVALDNSANVYVTGSSVGSGISIDYATVKYTPGGTEQWVARYNGPANGKDYATRLVVDGPGNTYVTGHSDGSGTWRDYATVKYNTDGIQQWVARYDGQTGGFDFASDLAVDPDGNVYVTGYSEGSRTRTDYATVKYNAAGMEQWVACYNLPGSRPEDFAYALAVDGQRNVYVSGVNQTDVSSFITTIKYVQIESGVGDEQVPVAFRLEQNYPNPFNPVTEITFQTAERRWVNLRVYDVLGREIATLVNESTPSGSHRVTWNGSGCTSGVYFCRLQAGDFVQTRKLVLLR